VVRAALPDLHAFSRLADKRSFFQAHPTWRTAISCSAATCGRAIPRRVLATSKCGWPGTRRLHGARFRFSLSIEIPND
jgi:hypothetical protein